MAQEHNLKYVQFKEYILDHEITLTYKLFINLKALQSYLHKSW